MAPLIDDNDDDEICADLHTEGTVNAVPVNEVEITQQNVRRRRRIRRSKYNSTELEVATADIEDESQSILSYSENIEVDENRDAEERSDNNEEHIYEVPDDDYGYWINNEDTEEDEQEIPFLSIKNIKSTINTNSLYEKGKCIICLGEKSEIVFIPCGHLCCCKNCIQKLLQERCPACNNTYSNYMPVITP